MTGVPQNRTSVLVTGGDDRRHCRNFRGKRKQKMRRTLQCAIPALPRTAAECFARGQGKESPVAEHQEKRSSVRLLSFLFRIPQMQIGRGKQLCKKLHILQKLSFLTSQTKGLASGAGWQSGMELCRARATSLKLL
jgi:hypothetical protein